MKPEPVHPRGVADAHGPVVSDEEPPLDECRQNGVHALIPVGVELRTTEFPDPESGSTSFFTYAMALGMLYGWLDQPTYMPVVKKTWAWLTTIIDANGKVGRCQPWSNQPGGAGLTNNTPEGQGAFMLAGEGMYLLATR